jgi:hypothetical protein
MKKQVKEFQQHAQQFTQQQETQEPPPKVQQNSSQPAPKKSDYIDFEEL